MALWEHVMGCECLVDNAEGRRRDEYPGCLIASKWDHLARRYGKCMSVRQRDLVEIDLAWGVNRRAPCRLGIYTFCEALTNAECGPMLQTTADAFEHD